MTWSGPAVTDRVLYAQYVTAGFWLITDRHGYMRALAGNTASAVNGFVYLLLTVSQRGEKVTCPTSHRVTFEGTLLSFRRDKGESQTDFHG